MMKMKLREGILYKKHSCLQKCLIFPYLKPGTADFLECPLAVLLCSCCVFPS